MNDIFKWWDGVRSWREVDWVHLVEGRGWYEKNPGGVIGSGNMHFCYYLSHSEGSRTRGQRLGGVKGERNE